MNLTLINEAISALHPEYFIDENMEPFAFLHVGGKIRAIPIRSGSFEQIVQQEAYRVLGTYIKQGDFKFFQRACVYNAQASGITRPLPVRVARDADGNIFYDLRRDDGMQVKISPDGWEIIPQQVIFRDVGREAPEPVRGGNISMLDQYLNIDDINQRILVKVALISMFVEDIAHPDIVLNGEQGSGKTCQSRVLKQVIDPSNVEVSHLDNSIQNTQLTLANQWVTAFDNLSGFSNAKSDLFCGVVTGQHFQKRMLYTDSEIVSLKLRRCLVLNGISGVVTRADLTDRSIIIDMRRLTEAERKLETQMFDSLRHDMPQILGVIFDILVGALRKRKELTFDFDLGGRLKDFAAWGFCVAEAMGIEGGGARFVEAYRANSAVIASEILEGNPMIDPLIGFLGTLDLPRTEKVSDFFHRFRVYTGGRYDSYVSRGLPQSPQSFSRDLKLCLGSLEARGYRIQFQRRAEGTFLQISRILANEVHAGDPIPDNGATQQNDPPDAA
jgi:hypothetical protein